MTHGQIVEIIFPFWITDCLLKAVDPRRFPNGSITHQPAWIFFWQVGKMAWWCVLVWMLHRFLWRD
jgi:hypothetical protein